MKNKLCRLLILVPFSVSFVLLCVAAYKAQDVQPPQITRDRLMQIIGEQQATIQLQDEYIVKLRQRIAELGAKLEPSKPEPQSQQPN